jgi:hypothetical protein
MSNSTLLPSLSLSEPRIKDFLIRTLPVVLTSDHILEPSFIAVLKQQEQMTHQVSYSDQRGRFWSLKKQLQDFLEWLPLTKLWTKWCQICIYLAVSCC